MKRYAIGFALGAALVLGMMGAAPISAQNGGAVIRVEPETLAVGQGQVETLTFVVENATEIYGIELRAEFDPQQIEIVDADPAQDGVQMTTGDFIKPDFVVRNEADNENGTLQYVITQVNPTPPASGTGVVLMVAVRGKTQGKTSPLKITFVETADRRGTKLEIEPQSGTVEVVAPKPETATPRAVAQASRTTTRQPNSPASTRVSTRPRATPTGAGAANTPPNALTDTLLILLAIGGCIGAFVILGLALVLVLRRPRNKPPSRRIPPRGGTV